MRTFFLLLVIASGTAAQSPQSYDVNGVKLGLSFSEWKKGAGAYCTSWQPVEPNVDSYSCPDLTFAGSKMTEIVNFYRGRLMSFYLLARHKDFTMLRSALKQKFGQPERTEQKTFSFDGITRTGEITRWSNGVSSVNIVEFGPDQSTTVLFFSQIEIMAEKRRNARF
jgi:hypothetical protein